MSSTASEETAVDINLLAGFLAHEQARDLKARRPVDCIIICASAVLFQAEKLFEILQSTRNLTKTLVLCGGVGHSTSLMWDAVSKSSKYSSLATSVRGKPESSVLEEMMQNFFKIKAIETGECKLLIEDKSTNCGANALNSRRLLEASDVPTPETCIIIQDPTMALRTIASFEKVYEDLETPPRFRSCPLFIPEVWFTEESEGPMLDYGIREIPSEELWEFRRFMKLILGEIPRLRNDETGYGPKGKGFITHVDIPDTIEDAWKRLSAVFGARQ